jgi:hypothetical protein
VNAAQNTSSTTLRGRATEFGPYISAITTVGVTGGVRYWALSL